jgi:hypothetical protein
VPIHYFGKNTRKKAKRTVPYAFLKNKAALAVA